MYADQTLSQHIYDNWFARYGADEVYYQSSFAALLDDTQEWLSASFATIPATAIAHYYDCKIDYANQPEYHHYPCADQMGEDTHCDYCQEYEYGLVAHERQYALHHVKEDFVSFEQFNLRFPMELTGERELPAMFDYQDLLLSADHYRVEDDSDSSDSYSSDDSSEDSYNDDNDDYAHTGNTYMPYEYDYYGNPTYVGIDTDSYTYGFDSSLYEKTPRDNHMLRHINWRNLRVIGAGQSAVTLTDGKYAIKVGSISRYDIERIEDAAKCGYSVPVFYFKENRKVPNKILYTLRNNSIYKYGSRVSWSNYVNRFDLHTDIAILGLATPFVEHDDPSSESDEYAAVASRLRYEFNHNTSYDWNDAHQFNMGWYNDALVILDF